MDGGGGEERRKGFEYSWQVCDWASQSPNPRALKFNSAFPDLVKSH